MQGLKCLAWHILLHCLSSAIFLNTPITQTSNSQAECQQNATLVAGFFSQNKIISSQQFIYQVQFCLDLPCILLCASMKRESICENGITLCFITYQPYQNQERTVVSLYLYKKTQRGLVLMFLPPTDLEVRYYRKQ